VGVWLLEAALLLLASFLMRAPCAVVHVLALADVPFVFVVLRFFNEVLDTGKQFLLAIMTPAKPFSHCSGYLQIAFASVADSRSKKPEALLKNVPVSMTISKTLSVETKQSM